jgi:hypothetical protein
MGRPSVCGLRPCGRRKRSQPRARRVARPVNMRGAPRQPNSVFAAPEPAPEERRWTTLRRALSRNEDFNERWHVTPVQLYASQVHCELVTIKNGWSLTTMKPPRRGASKLKRPPQFLNQSRHWVCGLVSVDGWVEENLVGGMFRSVRNGPTVAGQSISNLGPAVSELRVSQGIVSR